MQLRAFAGTVDAFEGDEEAAFQEVLVVPCSPFVVSCGGAKRSVKRRTASHASLQQRSRIRHKISEACERRGLAIVPLVAELLVESPALRLSIARGRMLYTDVIALAGIDAVFT